MGAEKGRDKAEKEKVREYEETKMRERKWEGEVGVLESGNVRLHPTEMLKQN